MNSLKKLSKLLPAASLPALLAEGFSDERILRWICQRSFLCFCMAVKPDYMATNFHTYLAYRFQKIYEQVKNGVDQRTALSCPPQHGKSTLASVLFPAWVLGKEAWPVIVASYGASLAERKSQEARDILSEPMFQLIFPGVKLHPDSTSKEFWRTTKGGSYRAVGVGGGLTGMSGKLMICDDPFAGMAEASSEVIRESTASWWKTVFYTRKQSKSALILINTRWHLDDVEGRLLEEEADALAAGLPEGQFDKWEHLKFPAIAEEDEYLDGKLFRRAGEVLSPERFTLEDMIKTRNSMKVEEWASLYQQNPILQENAKFKTDWFKYFTEKDITGKYLDVYVTVDPAISQKKRADNTSIQVGGKERNNPNIYHLEDITGKFDPLEIIQKLFELKLKYKDRLKLVGIESVAYQKSLLYFLTEQMRLREIYFNVVELKSKGSKEERIEGLIGPYKAGVIFHRDTDKEMETEFLQFPKGKHDDRIDAWSMMLDLIKNVPKNSGGAKRYVPKSTTYRH